MDTQNPLCPVCFTPMRQFHEGRALKKCGPAYVCPLAESETYRDESGHLQRFGWATHAYTRSYIPEEVEAMT